VHTVGEAGGYRGGATGQEMMRLFGGVSTR
jgi:hypothetical protein